MGFFLAVHLVVDGWSSGVGMKIDFSYRWYIFSHPGPPFPSPQHGRAKAGADKPCDYPHSAKRSAQRANLA